MGAKGGNVFSGPWSGDIKFTAGGGAGGYSAGYLLLEKDVPLYICVGGYPDGWNNLSGGYNGGGRGSQASGGYNNSAAGGATHIAKTNRGILPAYSVYRDEVLIAAGSGEGAEANTGDDELRVSCNGGSGGGFSGGSGTSWYGGASSEGTQTGGEAFGQGANGWGTYMAGGGGGWYGGKANNQWGAPATSEECLPLPSVERPMSHPP